MFHRFSQQAGLSMGLALAVCAPPSFMQLDLHWVPALSLHMWQRLQMGPFAPPCAQVFQSHAFCGGARLRSQNVVIDEDASYDISAFDYDAAASLYGTPSASKSFSTKPMRVSSNLRCGACAPGCAGLHDCMWVGAHSSLGAHDWGLIKVLPPPLCESGPDYSGCDTASPV